MKCDRCHRETDITIMSMLNTDILCLDCKEVVWLPPRVAPATARHHWHLEDLIQNRLMEELLLLRGEEKRNEAACDGPP